QAACGGFDDHHHSRHKRQLEHHMENLTGGTPPVRYLPCVVPCKLYFPTVQTSISIINITAATGKINSLSAQKFL
ncbi:hypothetical protein, partial [Dysosmobacter sp.]|uniref:hypothetical protein n=1 Tax=Dysosmobacter sp. TaxID=2591382 RepID=UPI003A93C8E3